MEAPSILAFRSDWPFEQLLAVSPLTHHSYQTRVLDIWLFLDHIGSCVDSQSQDRAPPLTILLPLADNKTENTLQHKQN